MSVINYTIFMRRTNRAGHVKASHVCRHQSTVFSLFDWVHFTTGKRLFNQSFKNKPKMYNVYLNNTFQIFFHYVSTAINYFESAHLFIHPSIHRGVMFLMLI